MPRYLISNLLGLVGAVIGGVLGFYTFRWLHGQGFYGSDDSGCPAWPRLQLAGPTPLDSSRNRLRRGRCRSGTFHRVVLLAVGRRRKFIVLPEKCGQSQASDPADDRRWRRCSRSGWAETPVSGGTRATYRKPDHESRAVETRVSLAHARTVLFAPLSATIPEDRAKTRPLPDGYTRSARSPSPWP